MLPQSGSAAVCGGKTGAGLDADATGATLTVDERGFPLDPSCSAGKTDAGAVQTNYLVVNSASDSDDGSCTVSKCTLRDAINAANTAGNADISFATSINGDTLTLTSNLPEVTAAGSVNIAGNGAGTFTIDGAGKYSRSGSRLAPRPPSPVSPCSTAITPPTAVGLAMRAPSSTTARSP